MELEAAKLIGAALALIPIAGVGVGLPLDEREQHRAVGGDRDERVDHITA